MFTEKCEYVRVMCLLYLHDISKSLDYEFTLLRSVDMRGYD